MPTDPFEQLKLMRQARKDSREDLQEIADANVGTAAATILAFNEQRAADLLLGADPNAPIDIPVSEGDPGSPIDPLVTAATVAGAATGNPIIAAGAQVLGGLASSRDPFSPGKE